MKVKGTISVNEFGTYWSCKPGGNLLGQGLGLYTTRDESEEMATWMGYGVGYITGSGRVSYRVHYFIGQIRLEN